MERLRERDTERERQTERERDTEREIQTERDARHINSMRQKERESKRERVRVNTDHGVEREIQDPLLVVSQGRSTERYGGVEGGQA